MTALKTGTATRTISAAAELLMLCACEAKVCDFLRLCDILCSEWLYDLCADMLFMTVWYVALLPPVHEQEMHHCVGKSNVWDQTARDVDCVYMTA